VSLGMRAAPGLQGGPGGKKREETKKKNKTDEGERRSHRGGSPKVRTLVLRGDDLRTGGEAVGRGDRLSEECSVTLRLGGPADCRRCH